MCTDSPFLPRRANNTHLFGQQTKTMRSPGSLADWNKCSPPLPRKSPVERCQYRDSTTVTAAAATAVDALLSFVPASVHGPQQLNHWWPTITRSQRGTHRFIRACASVHSLKMHATGAEQFYACAVNWLKLCTDSNNYVYYSQNGRIL